MTAHNGAITCAVVGMLNHRSHWLPINRARTNPSQAEKPTVAAISSRGASSWNRDADDGERPGYPVSRVSTLPHRCLGPHGAYFEILLAGEILAWIQILEYFKMSSPN